MLVLVVTLIRVQLQKYKFLTNYEWQSVTHRSMGNVGARSYSHQEYRIIKRSSFYERKKGLLGYLYYLL